MIFREHSKCCSVQLCFVYVALQGMIRQANFCLLKGLDGPGTFFFITVGWIILADPDPFFQINV